MNKEEEEEEDAKKKYIVQYTTYEYYIVLVSNSVSPHEIHLRTSNQCLSKHIIIIHDI